MDERSQAAEVEDLEGDVLLRTALDAGFPAPVKSAEGCGRLLRELAAARKAGGLSRTAVAARMRTSESAVARLEGGEVDPRISTLERFASAVGKQLQIRLRDRAAESVARDGGGDAHSRPPRSDSNRDSNAPE